MHCYAAFSFAFACLLACLHACLRACMLACLLLLMVVLPLLHRFPLWPSNHTPYLLAGGPCELLVSHASGCGSQRFLARALGGYNASLGTVHEFAAAKYFARLMMTHPWRTMDPAQAEVFIVPPLAEFGRGKGLVSHLGGPWGLVPRSEAT